MLHTHTTNTHTDRVRGCARCQYRKMCCERFRRRRRHSPHFPYHPSLNAAAVAAAAATTPNWCSIKHCQSGVTKRARRIIRIRRVCTRANAAASFHASARPICGSHPRQQRREERAQWAPPTTSQVAAVAATTATDVVRHLREIGGWVE